MRKRRPRRLRGALSINPAIQESNAQISWLGAVCPVNPRGEFQDFTGLLRNSQRGKLIPDMCGNCRCLGFTFLTSAMLGGLLPSDLVAQSETSATIAPSAGQSETARLGLITRTTALIAPR